MATIKNKEPSSIASAPLLIHEQQPSNSNLSSPPLALNVDLSSYIHSSIFDVVQPSKNLKVKLCSITNLETLEDNVYNELYQKQVPPKVRQQSNPTHKQSTSLTPLHSKTRNDYSNHKWKDQIASPKMKSTLKSNLKGQKDGLTQQKSDDDISSKNLLIGLHSQKNNRQQSDGIVIDTNNQLSPLKQQQKDDNDEIFIQLNLFAKKNQSSITPRNLQFLAVKKEQFRKTLTYLQSLNEIEDIPEEHTIQQNTINIQGSKSAINKDSNQPAKRLQQDDSKIYNSQGIGQQSLQKQEIPQRNQIDNIQKNNKISQKNEVNQLDQSKQNYHTSTPNNSNPPSLIINNIPPTNNNNNNFNQNQLIPSLTGFNDIHTPSQKNKPHTKQNDRIASQQNQKSSLKQNMIQTPSQQKMIIPPLPPQQNISSNPIQCIRQQSKNQLQQPPSHNPSKSETTQKVLSQSSLLMDGEEVNQLFVQKYNVSTLDQIEQISNENTETIKDTINNSDQKQLQKPFTNSHTPLLSQHQQPILRNSLPTPTQTSNNKNFRNENFRAKNISLLNLQDVNNFIIKEAQSSGKTADCTPFGKQNNKLDRHLQQQFRMKQEFASPASTNANSKQGQESDDRNSQQITLMNHESLQKDKQQFHSAQKEVKKVISPFEINSAAQMKTSQKALDIQNSGNRIHQQRFISPIKTKQEQVTFINQENNSAFKSQYDEQTLRQFNPQSDIQNVKSNFTSNNHLLNASQFYQCLNATTTAELSTQNALQKNIQIQNNCELTSPPTKIQQNSNQKTIFTSTSDSEITSPTKKKKKNVEKKIDLKKMEPVSLFIKNMSEKYNDSLVVPQSIQQLNNGKLFESPKFFQLEEKQNEVFSNFVSLPPFKQGKVKCGINDYIKTKKTVEMNRFKTYYRFGFSASNKDEKNMQLQNVLEGVVPSNERGSMQCSDLWSDKHVKIIHDKVNFSQEKQYIQQFIAYKSRNPAKNIILQTKKPSQVDYLAIYENYEKRLANKTRLQSNKQHQQCLTDRQRKQNNPNIMNSSLDSKTISQRIFSPSQAAKKQKTKSSSCSQSVFRKMGLDKWKFQPKEEDALLKEKLLFKDFICFTDRVLKNNAEDIVSYKKMELYEDEE